MKPRAPFRAAALEKLSSPEQLDRLMQVTAPKGWLALLGVGLVVVAAVLWSVFGRVTTTVAGDGILVKGRGAVDVVSLGAGQITGLSVQVGDTVAVGEVVASVSQPELTLELERARARFEEARAERRKLQGLGTEDVEVQRGYLASERSTASQGIRAAQERLRFLRKQRQRQAKLTEDGLVTRATLEATELEITAAEAALRDARAELARLSVSSHEIEGRRARDDLAGKMYVSEIEREIQVLEARLEARSRITSPHAGRVLELRVGEGELVAPGRPVLSLEPAGSEGSGLEALFFVPLAHGKSLAEGMDVHVAPANVRREEHGMLRARITHVSDFPSTPDGMKRLLGNELLVESLIERVGRVPVAVRAELLADPEAPSGYAWTSGDGPDLELAPGTPVDTSALVAKERPIVRVLPVMAKVLGD